MIIDIGREDMDREYPRKCYICQATIKWTHYLAQNMTNDKEWLTKIWKDKRVQLACCDCRNILNNKIVTKSLLTYPQDVYKEMAERIKSFGKIKREKKKNGKSIY